MELSPHQSKPRRRCYPALCRFQHIDIRLWDRKGNAITLARMSSVVVALIALASFVSLVSANGSGTGNADATLEVRVAAQRHHDGRIEFAIQWRQADATWSSRELPRVRFLPTSSTQGRWLSSTPVAVGEPAVTFRVAARRVSGGRTEFAVQRLDAGDVWSERLLPGRRFLPAASRIGRWLASTAVAGAPEFVGTSESDRAALVELFKWTGGDRWLDKTNWRSELPLGDWFGVTTDNEGRVIALALPENALRGPIPAAIGQLPRLQILDLRGREDDYFMSNGPICLDDLSGQIPTEIGNLTDLRVLDLSCNGLSGEIPPALGRLSRLESLDLGVNRLSGSIPAELGNLRELTRLNIWLNMLGGAIPEELGRLTKLEWLNLSQNSLSGPLPRQLGGLVRLEYMDLYDNEVSGSIPVEWGGLKSIQWLSLDHNQLSGPLPPSLGILTNLYRLTLSWNRITGRIPPEWGGLAGLWQLNLNGNMLSGPIPPELGQLPNLQSLRLAENSLTGMIPPMLGQLSKLRWLWLNRNELEGAIPAELGRLVNLSELYLSGNNLTGRIPPELRDIPDLWALYLGGNALSGCIHHLLPSIRKNDLDELGLPICESPQAAAAMADRETLSLVYEALLGDDRERVANWIDPKTPTERWPGVTTDLDGRVVEFNLWSADLAGRIPSELGRLTELRRLVLKDNRLQGAIPAELGMLTKLQHLDLRSNRLNGGIPPELGDLANLLTLRLDDNQLSGPIPPALGHLPDLRALGLSGNQLSGCVPEGLAQVADNDLQWLRLPDCN